LETPLRSVSNGRWLARWSASGEGEFVSSRRRRVANDDSLRGSLNHPRKTWL
jgi:hypothetical protein